ncbi:MAG TPA: carboxypeptidase regulatory-like domain-containing protein [Bryobacteraceae bacterium]|nr:carboxypeptidase regulatory-like domain-containing protein [Bryobacteraceae bacterium]
MNYRTVFAIFALILSAGYISAQSKTSGTLSGTVTDPTDSAVPGAKITATNTVMGAVFEASTDDRGGYRVPLLPPGTYDIKVEKSGFGGQARKGVVITVGEAEVVDFKLAVGIATQVVEVQGEALMIETERTQQSNTLDEVSVRNLPINRRDYLSFSLLVPGVTDSKALADSNSFRVKQTPDSGLSFYGSNGRGNNVSVDGGESNDSGGGVRPTVSQEAVQEFQVNRTNYSAEHGEARGGVIDIITKSGTNALHGSVFGFFRHQSLDATDPFAITLSPDNRAIRVKPDSQRQQFGATLGGPLAKDRTFYFVSYEQLRRRESNAVPVLTDVSIFQPTAAQQAIINTLPSTAAAQLTAALTSPPSTVEMFKRNSGIFPFQSDQYQGLARIDHRINDKNQVDFRYNITKLFETNQNIGALVGVSRGYVSDYFDSTVLANWTHTFSPTLINEARAQFNYYDAFTGSNDPFGPALEIAGFGFFNRDRFLPNETISRREDLSDSLTWVKGTHTLKMGVDVLIRDNHADSKTFFSGRFTFGTLPGAFVSPALASTSINALQAFNLGLAQSYQQGFGDPVVRAIYPLYATYIQDTWRVSPNFTLTWGLRYEIDHRKSPLPTDKLEFGPRLGFAWDPFHDKKTSIRGGYGMFYSTVDYQIDYVVNALNEINGFRQIAQVLTVLNAANPSAANGPINIFTTLRNQGIIGVPTPQRSIQASDLAQFGINVSQTGPRPPLTVLFNADPNYKNPYAHQASFGIDREFAQGLTASVSYVYVRGVHLTTSLDHNLLQAPTNPLIGIPYWGVTPDNPSGAKYFKDPLLFQGNVYESGANSWYNGLILEINKRFSRNATFAFNYTFSKAMDETLDFNSDFQPPNQLCRSCEKALSSFDQRHKVVGYAVLASPHASRDSSAVRKFFGDFLFTPIYRYNSSRPFNILAGTELNGDRHNTTDRPYFAGRNLGIGPPFWSFDSRLSRRFSVTEHSNIELMVEAFNLFNHLNYASVNNTISCVPVAISAATGAASGGLPGTPGSCYINDIVQRYGGLSGQGRYGPSQPFGFTSAFDPRRIQLGARFTF